LEKKWRRYICPWRGLDLMRGGARELRALILDNCAKLPAIESVGLTNNRIILPGTLKHQHASTYNALPVVAHMAKYTVNYCWVQNTYYIPMSEHVPRGDNREHEITYYQYVPMILLFSALCFKVATVQTSFSIL